MLFWELGVGKSHRFIPPNQVFVTIIIQLHLNLHLHQTRCQLMCPFSQRRSPVHGFQPCLFCPSSRWLLFWQWNTSIFVPLEKVATNPQKWVTTSYDTQDSGWGKWLLETADKMLKPKKKANICPFQGVHV